MINVAELMRDPDRAQEFTIERAAGAFANEGEWAEVVTTSGMLGIIQPAKREDVLELFPEGTRLGNVIVVYSDQELLIDNADTLRSDVVVWHGNPYRVTSAKHWADYGFWQVWAEGFVR